MTKRSSGGYLVYALTSGQGVICSKAVQKVGYDGDDPVSADLNCQDLAIQSGAYTRRQKRYAILTGVQEVLQT